MPNRSDAAPKGKSPQPAQETPALSGQDVAAYLRRHPDFFRHYPALLEDLQAPDCKRGDGVVDLPSFMVERLRDSMEEMTKARDDLLATGRNNQAIQNRIHQAILALLNARSFEQFIETITTDLAVIMDVDLVTIGVERTETGAAVRPSSGIYRLEEGVLEALTGGANGGILLRDNIEGDVAIFGAGAGLVSSDALLRLNIAPNAPGALLAFGSRQPDQFHAGQGTELLNFLARVLECCFRAWLELPA